MEFIPLTAIVGIAGIILGAWVNSILTTRRERWGLQRELYSRLLENIGEVKDALEHMLALQVHRPVNPGKEVQDAWEERGRIHAERAYAAEEKLRLATWTAAFILSKEVSESLENLRKEWRDATDNDVYAFYLEDKISSAAKAYDLLQKAAKRDLGFN